MKEDKKKITSSNQSSVSNGFFVLFDALRILYYIKYLLTIDIVLRFLSCIESVTSACAV